MLWKDKGKIVDKEVIRHIKERENIICDSIKDIVQFILGKSEDGYSVKSFLLTARTNYYGIQENDLNYLTWADFVEQVAKRKI